jgi:hypothetical protein
MENKAAEGVAKMAQQKAAMNRMQATQRLNSMRQMMNKPRPAMKQS